MFDVINTGIQIVCFLFQGYLLQYFLGSFLESRFVLKRWNPFFVAISFAISVTGVSYILPSDYGSVRIFGRTMLHFLIVLAIVFCFYKARRAITVFLAVTFIAINETCFFIAYTILQMGPHLTDFCLILFDRGYFAAEDSFMAAVEITLSILMFFMHAIYIFLTSFFLKRIVKNFREKEYAIRKKELLFILTPGLVGVLLCVLLRLIMVTVENETPRILYDKYPALMVLVPAIMCLSLMSVLYGVELFQDMIELNREKSSRIVLQKQIESVQQHIKEVEHIYSGVRSMKHDMKNTLAVIMGLASGNGEMEKDEFREYLSELNRTMDRLEIQFKTGNSVVDMLLNMKYHEARRILPDIQINAEEMVFPDDLKIQSYDIGVILGNALDNAVEACRKLKEERAEAETFIRLSTFKKGKMLFIEVENSFHGKIIRKKNSEFPQTDKADKKVHGIGLRNIKNTAEKYHGAVDWSVKGEVFTLSVMMKNESPYNK